MKRGDARHIAAAIGLLIVVLLATALAGPAPRPAPVIPSGAVAPTWVERQSSAPSSDLGQPGLPVPALTASPTLPGLAVVNPHPTAALGDVSWAWSPGYTPATPTPRLVAPISGVHGRASYYDNGPGLYAALPGPWTRGRWVTVCATVGGTTRCASAPVVTTCGCHTNEASAKIVDLSPDLMQAITGWTRAQLPVYGVVQVVMKVLR